MLCLINGNSISSLHSVILQDECEHTYIGIFTTSTNAVCINQPHTSLINPAIINLNSLSRFSVTRLRRPHLYLLFNLRLHLLFHLLLHMPYRVFIDLDLADSRVTKRNKLSF